MESKRWVRFGCITLVLMMATSSAGLLFNEFEHEININFSGLGTSNDSYSDSNSGNGGNAEKSDDGRVAFTKHADPLDPALRHRLRLGTPEEVLRIIVQFDSNRASGAEQAILEKHGFRTLHTTTVVPAFFAEGLAAGVNRLAGEAGVRWIEWNAPIVLLMNKTNSVIGSKDVWHRTLLDENGVDTGRVITGDGVTVIVLDSGIDATHPDLDYDPFNTPNSPREPGPDDKVIYNAKLDQGSGSSTPEFAWIPLQNTDTTSGHGTHVAGTVAGNGDASAQVKRGVAPGADLIGLSMGEAAFTIDEYSALEYSYKLSTPGSATQTAWNIKVVTNSWGPGFPFDSLDPNDLTVQAIEKLTYDNNVVVIFANGNDGGDGTDDRSNIFAKVPVAIGVAATMRDGIGMSDFSSRGDMMSRDTWPDIAAPGVDIWSAAARATMIGVGIGAGDIAGGDLDYHYLAISGTSMATPHVAGLVALLWQAAPSMKMSDFDEDLDSESGDITLVDPSGLSSPAQAKRYIHESELILKLTARYMDEGPNLADNYSEGIDSRPLDYTQGYGIVDAERAVAVAVALQQLRDPDMDGVEDANVTVHNALVLADKAITNGSSQSNAEGIETGWTGDFAIVSSASQLPPGGHMARAVWLPGGTIGVKATLDYDPLDISTIWCPQGANLRLVADTDGDGSPDEIGSPSIEMTIDGGTAEGQWWSFEVEGNALGTCLTPNPSTEGPEAHYEVHVKLKLLPGRYVLNFDESLEVSPYGSGAADITLSRTHFVDIRYEAPEPDRSALESVVLWLRSNWWVPTLLALFIASLFILSNERVRATLSDEIRRRRAKRDLLRESIDDSAQFDATEVGTEVGSGVGKRTGWQGAGAVLSADLVEAELLDDELDKSLEESEMAESDSTTKDGNTAVTGGLLGRAVSRDDSETLD